MKKTVYFVSGLGADYRVFSFLKLISVEQRHIHWHAPVPGEKLRAYCQRLATQINREEEVVLFGVSFGGIVAQELSHIVPCKQVIIISSVKSEQEFSVLLKLAAWLRFDRFLPAFFLKWCGKLMGNFFFSIKSKTDRQLLREIMNDTDPIFLKWAIGALLEWKARPIKAHLLHVHGTSDRIFPAQNMRNYTPISGGGHFMIVDRAGELSGVLEKAFNPTK